MTQQLDMLGLQLDEATTRRIGLPQQRQVRTPRLNVSVLDDHTVFSDESEPQVTTCVPGQHHVTAVYIADQPVRIDRR